MEEDAVNITKKIEEREKDFDPLWRTMDEDYLIWQVKESSYDRAIDAKTKRHGSDIDVIANNLRLFSDDVGSILSDADRQISVRMAEAEGKDKREDIGKLERMFDFAFAKADERLTNIILPPLLSDSIWRASQRGCIAGRFLIYKGEGGTVIFDFLSYDPRWLVYQVGSNGLRWTNHTTFQRPEELEDDYSKITKAKPWYKVWEKSKEVYKLRDYWKNDGKGKMTNSIICENEFLVRETYDIPSMPVLIVPVATRPPIVDSTGKSEMPSHGESIYAPLRTANGMRNRFLSMAASHANRMARQALINYKTAQGVSIPSTTNVPDAVVELAMGENRLEASPMKEISPSVLGLLNEFSGQVDGGVLPKVGLGNPPASGTAIDLVQESGNRVLNPQIRCLETFYAGACRLIEEQLLVGGITKDKISKVKAQGVKKSKYYEVSVKPVDLKKPHIIQVEFTARTPWTQMSIIQLADMLIQQGLPKGWVWENILKLQDPKLINDLLALEIYEHSPEGMMKRSIEVLMDRGYEIEALRLRDQLIQIERMSNQEEANARSNEPPPVQ